MAPLPAARRLSAPSTRPAHQDPTDSTAAPSDPGISGYVTKPIDFDRLLGSTAELTSD